MLAILLMIIVATLLLVTSAREVDGTGDRTWRRIAHGTLGTLAVTLGCSSAWITTAMAAEEIAASETSASQAESTAATTSDSASTNSGVNPAASSADPAPQIYTGPVYPADRPAWINAAAVRQGDVYTTVVSSGPYFSRRESQQAIRAELKKATDTYIDDYLNVNGAAKHVNFDIRYIEERLVDPDYVYAGTVEYSFGPMQEEYRMLRFDREFHRDLEQRWQEVVASHRLMKTGLGAGGLLLMLSIVLGYFKADTATRGYYSGRLQFSAAVAILTLIVFGVLLSGWIPKV